LATPNPADPGLRAAPLYNLAITCSAKSSMTR